MLIDVIILGFGLILCFMALLLIGVAKKWDWAWRLGEKTHILNASGE